MKDRMRELAGIQINESVPSELQILKMVWDYQVGANTGDIANKFGMSVPQAYKMMLKLEKRGWVVRDHYEDDQVRSSMVVWGSALHGKSWYGAAYGTPHETWADIEKAYKNGPNESVTNWKEKTVAKIRVREEEGETFPWVVTQQLTTGGYVGRETMLIRYATKKEALDFAKTFVNKRSPWKRELVGINEEIINENFENDLERLAWKLFVELGKDLQQNVGSAANKIKDFFIENNPDSYLDTFKYVFKKDSVKVIIEVHDEHTNQRGGYTFDFPLPKRIF